MCGISVIVDYGAPGTPIGSVLAAMHERQAHRGPDGEGFLRVTRSLEATRSPHYLPDFTWDDPGTLVAAAFRQLKIQDPGPNAEQPLGSPGGRSWILLNGVVYNFASLRDELAALGHTFVTSSDTEVALAAWRQWGEDCFARFNGMWAILIIDLERGRVIGSRDRLGIKPLFWARHSGRLCFASEPKALAASLPGGPSIDPERFDEFLRGYPPSIPAGTMFADVHPIPAASFFEVDLRAEAAPAPAFRRFWSLADVAADSAAPPSFAEAARELRDLIRDSVRLRIGGQVPVGCLLSGGLDSSVLACTMADAVRERGGTDPRAYSVLYDDPSMSEAPWVWSVARKAGLTSRTLRMTPALCWDSVDETVAAQGQPLLGQELIVLQAAHRMARADGTVIILEGQGADELLAGLPSYASFIFKDMLAELRFPAMLGEVRSLARRHGRSPLGVIRREVLGGLGAWLRDRILPRDYTWLNGDSMAHSARAGAGAPAGLLPAPSKDRSPLNRELHRLVGVTNLPAILFHQDRFSMAHGVESRAPYLDHRIVELCFRLPARYKVAGGERKRLLRHAARGLVPDLVLDRTDKKTAVSRADWLPLRGEMAEPLRAMAGARSIRECPFLRADAVASFVDGYLRGDHDDSMAVWRLYTAWRWLEIFGPS